MREGKLESLLNRENPYSEHIAFRIIEELYCTELYQFTENPVESESVRIQSCIIPITNNGETTRWLSVFTATESMKKCKPEPFFASASKCFQAVCEAVMSDGGLAGILLDPYVHTYTIPKEALRKWTAVRQSNDGILKPLQTKMESPDAALAGASFDIVFGLRSAYLPVPVMIQNGKKQICLYQANDGGGSWLAIFTDTDTLEASMKKSGGAYSAVEYYTGVFDMFAKTALEMKCDGIIVNPDSHGFKLSARILSTALQKR